MIKIENENSEIEKKRKEYSDYIDEHVLNVRKAFEELVDSEIPEIMEYLNELQSKINVHDKSKWSEEEFEPYRKNFFPINNEEKENNKSDFDKAWEHHYTNNDHHWQYWLDLDEETLKPFEERKVKLAYLEMIADWTGMGYKFGDTAYEYYSAHKDEIRLYPQLEDWVVNIMKQLDK